MSYRHKDTPESFWERMKAIHGPDYHPPVRQGVTYCSTACTEAQECCLDDCPFLDEMFKRND
jgi:hypothetical protein